VAVTLAALAHAEACGRSGASAEPEAGLEAGLDTGVDVATGEGGGQLDATDEGSVGDAAAWLLEAGVVVSAGTGDASIDCRAHLCAHNSDTDLAVFGGATFLVHRSAESDLPGPNASLKIYRRDAPADGGSEFVLIALMPAPVDRDIRAPHFFVSGTTLHLLALARLPVVSTRDISADTLTVESHSSDGITWTPLAPAAPHGWALWRVRPNAGIYYAAAYEDGETSVVLYSSPDGLVWTAGATIYGVAADSPNETELTFMPSGRLLALVRLDGTDAELLGDQGRLRTKTCWSALPYASFDCSTELDGVRLDGPVSVLHDGRLFVIAREHLQGTGRKRTALYELGGDFDAGPLTVKSQGDFPSAGDTSYAGVAPLDGTHAVVTWYSSDVAADPTWTAGMEGPTDIWRGTLDFTRIPP
jgi:hypothetical protein